MLKKMNKYLGKKCLGDQGNIIKGNLGKQTDWNCRDFVFSHLFSFSHLVASGLFYLPQPLTTLSCTFSSHFLWHNCHHPGVKANFWLLSVKSDSKSDLSIDCVFCSLLDIFMLISLEIFLRCLNGTSCRGRGKLIQKIQSRVLISVVVPLLMGSCLSCSIRLLSCPFSSSCFSSERKAFSLLPGGLRSVVFHPAFPAFPFLWIHFCFSSC